MIGITVRLLILTMCASVMFAATPRTPVCVGSTALGSFRLLVKPANGKPSLPLRQVNRIAAGDKITYQPINLPADLRKDAKLALVVAPADTETDGNVTVLEPKPASGAAEWVAPFRAGVVGVVFGPQGLDEKRLTSLVSRDEEVITQLAQYAEQTAELELTIAELHTMEETEEAFSKPVRYNPSEQALLALLRSVNPAAASYDPFGAGRRQGPTTKGGMAAAGFFDNAGAIVPGGGALSGLKGFLMPDTEFRSVFAQPEGVDGVTFCGQRPRARTRNKITYFWAYRLLSSAAPTMEVVGQPDLQAGRRNIVPVRLEAGADNDALDKFYDWRLEGRAAAAVRVKAIPGSKALLVDLADFKGAPGKYQLASKWDWDAVAVRGELVVHAASNLKAARPVSGASAIFAESGIQHLRFDSADFHFVEQAELVRPGGWRGARTLDFAVTGATANQLEVAIDSARLEPGRALLRLTSSTGATEELPVEIVPPMPKLDGLPWRANLGETRQRIAVRSAELDRIESIMLERGEGVYRDGVLEVTLPAGAKPGDRIAGTLMLKGYAAKAVLPGLLQVAPKLPRITEAKAAPAAENGVALRAGELPAGTMMGFLLKVEGGEDGAVTVNCAEAARILQAVTVRPGERRELARLERTGEGTLLLMADPAIGQPGCTLQAAIELEGAGKSAPAALGKVVRLPQLSKFTWLEEKSGEGYFAEIEGRDLESIARAGWEAGKGVAVTSVPMSASRDTQTIRISLPWPPPSPRAPLYIWLRGDTEGRLTKLKP